MINLQAIHFKSGKVRSCHIYIYICPWGNNVNILVLGIASFAYKVKNTISISKLGKGMKRGKVGPRVFVVGTQRGPLLQPKQIYIVMPFYPLNGTIAPEVGNVVPKLCVPIFCDPRIWVQIILKKEKETTRSRRNVTRYM